LRRHPEEQERIRAAGRYTAEQFLWDRVIENLVGKLEFLARKQNISFPEKQAAETNHHVSLEEKVPYEEAVGGKTVRSL